MFISNKNALATTLEQLIINAKNILLLTHKNPDGDGLATCLALKTIINGIYKKDTAILLEKEAPDFLDFLNVQIHTTADKPQQDFDLIIITDCHEFTRAYHDESLLINAKKVIFIDHHEIVKNAIKSNFLYYIDPHAVSTGVILHDVYKHFLQRLSKEDSNYYAQCIYTTILNDTDNFINSNVDAKVFSVCHDLMKYELNPQQVVTDFLLKKPPQYYQFIGNVLSTIEIHNDKRVLFMHSSLQMLERLGLDQDASSKMMRWVKGVKDIDIQVYFQQVEEKLFRISLRSDKYEVNTLASFFGGGGHKKAAGCEIKGTLTEAKSMILEQIRHLS
ncbi:MAG TPA: DHH family phosphoesterase [Candidatus Cloacimonadota bacterium]|nr:DHH family phosphoesterase [Candidatus Cloacimonadota bacterium]